VLIPPRSRMTKPPPKVYPSDETYRHFAEEVCTHVDVQSVNVHQQLEGRLNPEVPPTVRFPSSRESPTCVNTPLRLDALLRSKVWPRKQKGDFHLGNRLAIEVSLSTLTPILTSVFPSPSVSLSTSPLPPPLLLLLLVSEAKPLFIHVEPPFSLQTVAAQVLGGMPPSLRNSLPPTFDRDVLRDVQKISKPPPLEHWRFRQPKWVRRLRPKKPGTPTSTW